MSTRDVGVSNSFGFWPFRTLAISNRWLNFATAPRPVQQRLVHCPLSPRIRLPLRFFPGICHRPMDQIFCRVLSRPQLPFLPVVATAVRPFHLHAFHFLMINHQMFAMNPIVRWVSFHNSNVLILNWFYF